MKFSNVESFESPFNDSHFLHEDVRIRTGLGSQSGRDRETDNVGVCGITGTTLTDQNSIQEEIKSILKLGNACYHSVQNLLSSNLLSKNIKMKIYKTIIFHVA